MNPAAWAERYVGRFGLALTWSPRGEKGPRHTGWKLKENAITDAASAAAFWRAHPDYGIGVLLSYSGLVSLDIDHTEHSRAIFSHCGIDLEEFRKHSPCIIGNPAKFRLMFEAPADIELRHRTVMWPKPENVAQGFAVFELRAGPISDALPPTNHVGTGKPYRWENPPRNGFPPLPARILELWQDWLAFNRQARALCPWAPQPKETPKPKARANEKPRDSVIAAFNTAHDVAAILETHGYERRGKRFASPETSHGAGVVLLDDGRAYCHHAGDPLSGEHAHDAFDVYRLLQHGGDYRAAVKAAAQELGLGR
jgi:Bifunctional DNA primase/polymerase, N-terminal